MTITPDTLLLDYGCGIGRLAYELIQRHNCRVVGVDISPSMRALSVVYTRSDRFMSCSHDMLEGLTARGLRFDAALSLWVLQHCATPAQDIARIRNALRPDGQLFVVNGVFHSVPTLESGWVNDGLDVKAMLAAEFPLVHEGRLAREKTTESLCGPCFLGELPCLMKQARSHGVSLTRAGKLHWKGSLACARSYVGIALKRIRFDGFRGT